MTRTAPRVRFQNLSKRYPGVQALDDVTFAVQPACVHAIVGENGAGKSTLLRILAGATSAEQGFISLDGQPVQIRTARQAQTLGIATVYQEFNLAPELNVSENVFLGRWPRRAGGLICFRTMHARAQSIFESLGVRIAVQSRVAELSVAQQQMVEIARALSQQARVLALDEPSAVLTPHELGALFRSVRLMTSQGVSVLYISHRLDEIFDLADHVTVLRDGRHISTKPIANAARAALIHEMVGRPIEEEYPARTVTPGQVVLRVENLSSGRSFQDVSFEVRAGEVLGLTGLVGSGRSSLGRALSGALSCSQGIFSVGGCRGPFHSPRQARRAGVAFLPEDRKKQGLLLARPVRENISLCSLRQVSSGGVLRVSRERRLAGRRMEELNIRAPNMEVAARTLSGGNQQKVMFARSSDQACRLLILDEPARGVDVGAKVEIYGLINRMAARGTAVLMITSELPEAIGMADRIGVMCRGSLSGIVENAGRSVSQETILRLAVGESAQPKRAATCEVDPR